MLFPNLPEKWKKAIPAFLDSAGSALFGFQLLFQFNLGWWPNIAGAIAIILGVLLGINWTPKDLPA